MVSAGKGGTLRPLGRLTGETRVLARLLLRHPGAPQLEHEELTLRLEPTRERSLTYRQLLRPPAPNSCVILTCCRISQHLLFAVLLPPPSYELKELSFSCMLQSHHAATRGLYHAQSGPTTSGARGRRDSSPYPPPPIRM